MIFLYVLISFLGIFLSSTYGVNVTTIATINETTSSLNCTDNTKLDFGCIDDTLKNDQSSLLQLVAVTLVSGVWILYLTFYNSRIIGLILSRIINHFLKDAHFHAGSFSFSVLSGKLMFRNVSYITKDYFVHINDGYCIFRWWRPYSDNELSKQREANNGQARLSVCLFGFECHVYNQAQVYETLENLVDQKESVISRDSPEKKTTPNETNEIEWWRSLFPIIKVFIAPGKLVFGNRLLPNTLVFSFTEGDFQYKTTEASNCNDLFLHVFEAGLKSTQLMLVPSLGFDPTFTPPRLNVTAEYMEPPPRKMREGYVVAHSNTLKINYCWDEPGIVQEKDEKPSKSSNKESDREPLSDFSTLPTSKDKGPLWEVVIQFGKQTTFNYGPWADRQRVILWNYFYPLDYQNLQVTKRPGPGELRISSALKVSAMLVDGADFDLLFSRKEGIGAMQIHSGEGSFIEITVPMIVNESGYNTSVSGQLLHAEISTSLQYRNLLKAEMLGFDVQSEYPLQWNGFELWNIGITASKASLSFVFSHQEFFSDLVYDWSYKSHADLMFFVPYTYKFHIQLDVFELFLPVNKHNWVDCQTKPKDNAYLAVHGKCLSLDFDVPNETFLPDVCSIPFTFLIQESQLCAFLPESNMARNNLLNLAAQQQKWNAVTDFEDIRVNWNELEKKSWGLVGSDWVIVGEIPNIELSLCYTWHPIIIPYKAPARDRTSFYYSRSAQHRRQKSIDIHHSAVDDKKTDAPKPRGKSAVTFDPTCLDPDVLRVDVNISSGTVLILYGSIIDLVVAFKDNYLGYDDEFTDFSSNQQLDVEHKKSSSHTDNVLQFRPFEVKVNVNLQNINAVLPIHFTTLYETQPKVTLDQLRFEMDKNCLQTRLQLVLVNLNISVKERSSSTPDLLRMSRNCRFQLSNLQLRGHAMFSNAGVPLGSVLIEYAWLIEVLIGDIKGLLSVTQMQALIDWLEAFVFLSTNESNQLKKAYPNRKLPTGVAWQHKKVDGSEIEETDVKYCMSRVVLQSVQLRLAHDRTLFDLTVSPVNIANGNVQDKGLAEAVSVNVRDIVIKHYVLKPPSENWLEAGEVFMGPILAHVYIACKEKNINLLQDEFLRFHDKKTRRLFFVWEQRFSDVHLRKVSPLLESVKSMGSWGCAFFAPFSPSEAASYPNDVGYLREQTSKPISETNATDGDPRSVYSEDTFEAAVGFGVSLLENEKVLIKQSSSGSSKVSPISSTPSSSPTLTSAITRFKVSSRRVVLKSPEKRLSDQSVSKEEKLFEKTSSLPSLSDVRLPTEGGQSVASDLYQSVEADLKSLVSSPTSDDEYFSAESDFEAEYTKGCTHSSPDMVVPGVCCNMKKLPPGVNLDLSKFNCHNLPAVGADIGKTDSSMNPLHRPADLALFETPRSVVRKLDSSVGGHLEDTKYTELLDGKRNNLPTYTKSLDDKSNDDRTTYAQLSDGKRNDDTTYAQASDLKHYDDIKSSDLQQYGHKTNEGLPGLKSLLYSPVEKPIKSKTDVIYPDIHAQESLKNLSNPSSLRLITKIGSNEKSQELASCYSYILATAKLENDSDWLPKLKTIQKGIHPSVIVDNQSKVRPKLNRRSSLELFRNAQVEDCTSVILHVQGGVNVQISPYLLDSIQEIVDVLTTNATKRHPSAVLSHLQASCTRDAIIDHQLSKLNPEMVGDVFASTLGQAEGSKTKLKVFMDVVRVNIVQATPGDEAVFNLHQNKMLPTPCITVAALRLDRLDVSAQLNNKTDKLITKARSMRISQGDSDLADESALNDALRPFVIFSARVAVHSLASQLRLLSHNGLAPDRSNIVALAEENCRSPFKFNDQILLPTVKEAMKQSGYHRRPPKPWGWVMFEAGINTISAQLLKHDVAIEDPSTNYKHLSEGFLTVETLWLNAVTPQSSSQQSKVNKAFRCWNLLTALAPSCCAWLTSVDHLMGALAAYNDKATDRYFTTVAASLALASKSILDKEDGMVLKPTYNKQNLLSDLSTAIKSDASCILCDFLQLHFRDLDNLADLETALSDERNLPASSSLELGIRLMLGQFLRLENKPAKKTKVKRVLSVIVPPTPGTSQAQTQRPVNPNAESIEMSLLKPPSQHYPGQTTAHSNPSANQRVESVVLEQQRSGMYSWMQNQTQSTDVESHFYNNGKTNEQMSSDAQMLTESVMREASETFCNFLFNAGVENVVRTNNNLLQAYCGGSIALHANIATIKMEKQNADRLYIREGIRKSTSKSSRSLIEAPVIVCKGLAVTSSLIDSPFVGESKTSGDERRRSSFSAIEGNVHKLMKNRSTLSINVNCSVSFVKQRIDIALVRLVHQFVATVKIVQQSLTDMKVTKYTEGALSPDPFISHRRGLSTVSANIDSPALHSSVRSSTGHALRRRVMSDRVLHTTRDPLTTDSNSSISDESIAPFPCWQDLYRLIDQHHTDLPESQFHDTLKIENEMRRAFNYGVGSSPLVYLRLSGSIELNKIQLVAEVGDLALSIMLLSLDVSINYVKKGVSIFRNEVDTSLDASLKEIEAELNDNQMNNKKTILTSQVGMCSFDISTSEPDQTRNKCSINIGKIMVELPQRPSSIHDVVSKSSRRLSVHIQEFATTPGFKVPYDFMNPLNSAPQSATNLSHTTPATPHLFNVTVVDGSANTSIDGGSATPMMLKIKLVVECIEFTANLLPSSIVRYSTEDITGGGEMGSNGSFEVRLLKHAVHLNSSISFDSDSNSTSTVIALPQIVTTGELKQHRVSDSNDACELQMKEGEYLSVSVRVGHFEQTLNTDIVNQLIHLEEVVVYEVGDILAKMNANAGAMASSETSLKTTVSSHHDSHLLYQLQLQLDGIQVTATTSSKNAVRLKTGTVTFELSNRVVRANQRQREKLPKYMKIFGKAQVELNLGLGTLIYNSVYPEVEPEFQQLAYFTTRIGLQNTTQSQENASLLGPNKLADDNSILIKVMRPIFFIQPTAFDKAILFYLVYKNAYDEWKEKREFLESNNFPKRSATQMLNALQNQRANFDYGAAPSNSLFLQLAVDDLGICLPVSKGSNYSIARHDELSSALVLTIDKSMINVYYSRSLVSAGQFNGFCLRFADDFQISWDDWAPKMPVVNSVVVPDGTYQICTDTTSYQGITMGARTSVNVVWKMKGIDVNLDTNIGYYLTRIVDAMTLITGNSSHSHSSMSEKLNESESQPEVDSVFREEAVDGRKKKLSKKLRKSPSRELAWKEKSKKIEQEYNEQVKVISDLRSLGAKPQLIEEQEDRLRDLEVQLSSLFRKTVRNRFRRASVKPSVSSEHQSRRPSHQRSTSAGIAMAVSSIKPLSSPFSTLPSATHHRPSFKAKRTNLDGDFSLDEMSSDESDRVDDLKPDKIPSVTVEDSQAVYNSKKTESADLELILDVRIVIDGGKIVCQPSKEEISINDLSLNGHPRFTTTKELESNKTVFHVPAVTVKCRYNSGVQDAFRQSQTSPAPTNISVSVPTIEVQSPGGSTNVNRKRSSIYISFALQSLPETIISPCFLDFLEQTLQAIPVRVEPDPVSTEDLPGAVDSLDFTIASLTIDAVVYVSIEPSHVLFNCQPVSRVECLLHIPSLDACFSNIRNSEESTSFPFYADADKDEKSSESKVFPSGLAVTVVMSDFSIYIFHPYGAQVPIGGEQKTGSGRKDSLSVDLEVVRINFVRGKKGSANVDSSFLIKEKASTVNMSVLLDIGTACFKYDMRRLNEILAIPRAWYRRSIARRLFFGDTNDERLSISDLALTDSPTTPRKVPSMKPASSSSTKEEWVSVVLYCLKMSRLNVEMNMGNVMGLTVWSCDNLRSQGKLAAQSNGDQDLFLSCDLGSSQLTAKQGIIGGQIELRELHASCRVLEPIKCEPRHKLSVKMQSLDGRIEYMGGCIMIGKLTKVDLKLSDEWKAPKPSLLNSVEKSSVFVSGDFSWEKFSLAISRSTTPDVIKMLAKLEEFFTQQFQNSVRAITSLTEETRRGSVSRAPVTTPSSHTEYAFYRHWPSLYAKIRSLDIQPNFLLGGSFCLRGSHLTIACFHGNNFRSKTWILFNILEPNIMFFTEVQEIKESMSGHEVSTFSIQRLTFNLGHDYYLQTSATSSDPMATVSRVNRSRNDNPPPNSASIDEWFAYITASHNEELSMLRTLNDIRGENTGSTGSVAGLSSLSFAPTSYTHDTDIIFALPKLQLDFKTEHTQGSHEPQPPKGDKPLVECSFVTEFTDHICVTMDIELIMCLHDLISSYLKEKQQALSSRSSRDHNATPVDPVDFREFVCNTWQLEPTVRLISWAGRKIEPVGVDFILQKLGFRHARTTIPKWFQRGVLDVLDQTLALIVQNLLVAMHQRKRI